MTAYCMKCRKKVEIQSPKKIKMKNGRQPLRARVVSVRRRSSGLGRA